ncbi:MAG: hypothetical protein KAJ07_02690 [Planctomycetes bacterium]|nr:hypothetical protein [Planctomycetota bacterium]
MKNISSRGGRVAGGNLFGSSGKCVGAHNARKTRLCVYDLSACGGVEKKQVLKESKLVLSGFINSRCDFVDYLITYSN